MFVLKYTMDLIIFERERKLSRSYLVVMNLPFIFFSETETNCILSQTARFILG